MPCQYDGSHLRPGKQPCPPPTLATDLTDWGAFESKHGFKMAELLYSKAHMLEGNINTLSVMVLLLHKDSVRSVTIKRDLGEVERQNRGERRVATQA